jgi:hypothetical protein
MFVGAEWMFKLFDRHSIAFPACDNSTHTPRCSTLCMYLLWQVSAHLRDIQVYQVVKAIIDGPTIWVIKYFESS